MGTSLEHRFRTAVSRRVGCSSAADTTQALMTLSIERQGTQGHADTNPITTSIPPSLHLPALFNTFHSQPTASQDMNSGREDKLPSGQTSKRMSQKPRASQRR